MAFRVPIEFTVPIERCAICDRHFEDGAEVALVYREPEGSIAAEVREQGQSEITDGKALFGVETVHVSCREAGS